MLKIGHRGARAYEPENTLRSFKKALELGVDAVELDVGRTKDGEIVVIHDAEVDRTTDGKGSVSEHDNGLKVLVWTINKREEVSEYVKKGVDGIASDRPDILKVG